MSANSDILGPVLVTGGAGFIGSNFVMRALERGWPVVMLDALTYAANPLTPEQFRSHPNFRFIHGSIADEILLMQVFAKHCPWAVVNFAAESHVDRSIDSAAPFWSTNVGGTCTLLEAALRYWRQLPRGLAANFRFLHVSTDEVFGSSESGSVAETARYEPTSSYAASKAAADHFVRAYHKTYGLPTLVTHSVNNYGPYQFPEKLIALTILTALEEGHLPVYGNGKNVREWIYVHDHCEAIIRLLGQGVLGETYNIGSGEEHTNLSIVQSICAILDRLAPRRSAGSYELLIKFVEDRPGHDFRYALDSSKIRDAMEWAPQTPFEVGLERTVQWYLDNEAWWSGIWGSAESGNRLGLLRKKVR
jgi:dTDP-glucose 4,6-dehydratase